MVVAKLRAHAENGNLARARGLAESIIETCRRAETRGAQFGGSSARTATGTCAVTRAGRLGFASGGRGPGRSLWRRGPGRYLWRRGPGRSLWRRGPGRSLWRRGPGRSLWRRGGRGPRGARPRQRPRGRRGARQRQAPRRGRRRGGRGRRGQRQTPREQAPSLQLCLQLIKAVLQRLALLAVEAQLAEGALELIRPCQIVYAPAAEGL